ncbi:MAG: hypothetical protein KKD44_22810 [Proteobacteria bacterium]|nr:hypothetical protein [Pseudomonadota bacterium]
MTTDHEKNVKFNGNQIKRDDAVRFVDTVLKEKGRFDDSMDLSGGISTITDVFKVLITDDDDSFSLALEPLEGGEEKFTFTIDKGTGTIYRHLSEIKPQAIDDEDIDFLDEL